MDAVQKESSALVARSGFGNLPPEKSVQRTGEKYSDNTE